MTNYLFSEFPSLHVAVGNRFESCEEFKPTDFLSVVHVQYRGTQVVKLNGIVTGRFVTLYQNGTGVLQLSEVMVFGTLPVQVSPQLNLLKDGIWMCQKSYFILSRVTIWISCSCSHEWKFRCWWDAMVLVPVSEPGFWETSLAELNLIQRNCHTSCGW